MENILIIAVVGLIVGLAVGYIYKQKKNGAACIGCGSGCSCADNSGKCGNCHCK